MNYLYTMVLKIIETADGSSSIYNEALDETYHSRHGAIQEAQHVFLQMGLHRFSERKELDILEMGFGTGLNTWLTLLEQAESRQTIRYCGVEAYPLKEEEYMAMNYVEQLQHPKGKELFERMHAAEWEEETEISKGFFLEKHESFFKDLDYDDQFDLIYFDAFGPRVQPELWTEEIFRIMFKALRPGGLLTTYSSKGDARRAMIASGFRVEKHPGPPGKREMLIAFKDE